VAELAAAQVIALAGEIDPGMVIALHRRIDRTLDAGASRVVLDLGAVTVLGGQTVSMLCGALRRLTRRGATISIAGSPPHVQRVLERCAIDRLEQYTTGEAALMAVLLNPAGQPAFATPGPEPGSGMHAHPSPVINSARPVVPPLRAPSPTKRCA
jgi:anti-anti-sigma factor